jgi:hypothetical protein
MVGGGSCFKSASLCVLFFVEPISGGGGSVRRRNTLHVVGGRQLSLSQARFMGRENILFVIKYKKKENDIFVRVKIKYF